MGNQANEGNSILKIATDKNKVREIILQASAPLNNGTDEISMADYLVSEGVKDKLCHVNGIGSMVYDGKRWAQDPDGIKADKELQERCKETVSIIRSKLFGFDEKDPNQAEAKKILAARAAAVNAYSGHNKRSALMKTLRPHISRQMSSLDGVPGTLNTPCGFVDLSGNALFDASPAYGFTQVTCAHYDREAHSEVWQHFLLEVMSGDVERAKFLQKLCGYAIAGNPVEDIAVVLYGATTRNGKTTFLNAMQGALGDYARELNPAALAATRTNNAGAPSEEFARLRAVRLVVAQEAPANMLLDAALLKTLTGRDRIIARYLYQQSFEYTPEFVIFLSTNHLPRVNDMTLFSSNRLIVVPFERHFEEHEQDKELAAKLSTPEAQSAILNWCIEGYQTYQREGLRANMPKAVQEAVKEYRQDSDVIGKFLEECTIECRGGKIQASSMYSLYTRWAEENGHSPMTQTRLSIELKQRGLSKGRSSEMRFFADIMPRSDLPWSSGAPYSVTG